MAVVTLKGSRIITGLLGTTPSMGDPGEAGGRVRVWTETVEVGSADSATSTYHLARLPSAARILGTSRVFWDDLASSGAPTLDIGVFNPTGRAVITDDDDALNDGLDAATVNTTTGSRVVKDIANIGKRLWEYVAQQTEDPKGQLDIKVTLKDADVNVGGTLSIELYYTLD